MAEAFHRSRPLREFAKSIELPRAESVHTSRTRSARALCRTPGAHRNDRLSKYIEIGFRIDVYCFTEVMTLGKEYSIRGIVFMSFAQGLDGMPLMA